MTGRDVMRQGAVRGSVVAVSVIAGAVLFGAMGGSSNPAAAATLEELREQGFARLAIANEPPYTEVKPDGKVSGAAVEVARAVLAKLGVGDVVASISEYGAMIPGLQAGRFDLVTAGLFIKPERCAAVIYSEPDVCDAEALAVKAGNPLGFTSFADIAANDTAKVGAPGGGTEERLALEAGVPRDRVIVVPDGSSGIKMLQDGRIDAYSLPALSLNDLLSKANDPNIEVIPALKDTPIYCAGAAFHKDDTALRDAYNEVLAEMKKSGEFAEIVEPFGFPAEAASMVTTEELCSRQ